MKENKVNKERKNRRRSIRRLKSLPLAMIVLIISSMLVAGAFMTFFVRVETEVSVGSLFIYNDSLPAEDLIEEHSINGVAGNTYSYNFDLRLMDTAQNNVSVSFSFTNDSEIHSWVEHNGVEIDSYEFAPNDWETFTLKHHILENATAGTYQQQLTIDYL